MAREESESLLVSDVEALLMIVGAAWPAAPRAAEVRDGLRKLLPAREVQAGAARKFRRRSAAQQSLASAVRAGRTSARVALDDSGRCLSCRVVREGGPALRVEFRRDPRDRPFGDRELKIVEAMGRTNWLRPDGFGRFDGFDKLAAGKLAAGKLTAGKLTAGKLTAGAPTAGEFRTGPSSMVANLPRRQQEVLDRLRNGDSGKELAKTLHMSLNTAKEHVKRLCKRFSVSSRPELIARLFCGDQAKAGPARRRVM